MKKLISLLFIVSFPVMGLDLSFVPVAGSVQESHQYFDQRLQVLAEDFARKAIPDFKYKGPDPVGPMIGRILTGRDIHQVNAKIMLPSTRATSEVGTDFSGVLGACQRKGDYDFILTS